MCVPDMVEAEVLVVTVDENGGGERTVGGGKERGRYLSGLIEVQINNAIQGSSQMM